MVFSSKMHIILGLLQLTVLINISQSFVLLTANMEDVRKLAKKFVSESLAEQIVDFIATVSTNSAGNVANLSEENEQNAVKYQEISGEDDFRNNEIARHRSPNKLEPKQLVITTRTTKNVEKKATEKSRWPNFINQNKKYKPTKNKQATVKRQSHSWTNKHRLSANQPDFKYNNKEVKEPLQKTVEYRPDKLTEVEPLQELVITDKTIKQHRKPRKKQNIQTPQSLDNNIDSTAGYAEAYESNEKLNFNRHRISQSGSDDIKQAARNRDIDTMHVAETTMKYQGFNIGVEISLTTEKEKNEFDQYDNKQYPRSEFVATSGPVSLPKMPSQSQLWDKNISEIENSKEHSRKRKAWF